MQVGQLISDSSKNVKLIVNAGTYDVNKDERLLIPFVQGRKIGFINKNGVVVVEAKYDIYNGDVYTEYDYIKVGIQYSYAYDRTNDVPQVYTRYRYGVINSQGECIVEPNYGGIIIDKESFIVRKAYGYDYDGTVALLSKEGKEIVPFGIYSGMDPFYNGLTRCRKRIVADGKTVTMYGVIDNQGNVILDCVHKNLLPFYGKYTSINYDIFKELINRECPEKYDDILERERKYAFDNMTEEELEDWYQAMEEQYAPITVAQAWKLRDFITPFARMMTAIDLNPVNLGGDPSLRIYRYDNSFEKVFNIFEIPEETIKNHADCLVVRQMKYGHYELARCIDYNQVETTDLSKQNEKILFSNDKLRITQKETYLLCESKNGIFFIWGNFKNGTYLSEGTGKTNLIEYKWSQRTSTPVSGHWHNYVEYKFQYNKIDDKITLFEEKLHGCGGMWKVYNETTLNSSLSKVAVKILDIAIDPRFKYDFFMTENFRTVIHHESENVLIISSYDYNYLYGGGLLEHKVSNVKEWDIAKYVIGNTVVYFPYLIINHFDGHKSVWSFVSLKHITGEFKSIHPVPSFFHTDFYTIKNCVFFETYKTSICVDSKVYNDNFKSYDFEDWFVSNVMKEGTLLDACENYVSYKHNGLHLVRIDNDYKKVQNVKYIYKEVNDIPILSFREGINNYVSYDIKHNKFIVDVDSIKAEENKRKKYDFEDHEHYSIMDALDGEPDAYWNID